MVIVTDTSVLVAAFIREHRHYDSSILLLTKIREGRFKALIAAHSLFEFYATLTAIPRPSQVMPSQVQEVMKKDILPFFENVFLEWVDHQRAIDRTAEKTLRSGAIYDSLIFQSALKVRASKLVTWNVKDFSRLSSGEIEIVTPEGLG